MSIESELNEVLDGFVQSSAGLFDITGRYVSTYEQGVYNCAIAKPSKRIRTALGVDRELLVVASNFKDQQQRSIKFVRHEIDNSAGRFEPTLAVFIHNDPEGNSKLKNWGRDQGISVLPLYRPLLSSNPEDLERALCNELYSHDPFDVTGPVSDDSNFFGRRDEAIDLARKLQRNQIRSCLGIRKIGKTSIINRIVREITANHDCVCIMADCSRDDVWAANAASIMMAISESVNNSVHGIANYQSIKPIATDLATSGAREVLEASILASQKPVVIIFDEIDYITPGSPTAPHWRQDFNVFWRNFRATYQEVSRQTKNLSVLVSGVSTHWFSVESIDGIENAALSFVPDEYLSPMAEGATVAMLKRLSKSAGLRFDDSSLELVARTAANMPFWARKCGSWINAQIPSSDRPTDLNIEQVKPMVEKFAQDEGASIAAVALKHLFRVHPGLQDAAFKCIDNKAHEIDRATLRILSSYGLLDKNGKINGAMLEGGLSSIDRPEEVQGKQVLQPISDMDEWAEDIAAISKRRNLLERRLRDLVLNWIRQDSASDSTKPSSKERLLAVFPTKQRAQFAHVGANDVVQRLLWTQLAQLIEKEWQIFSYVFGDKQQFHQDANLINDRFDAHAKLADKADFALYRRALTSMEQKIDRL
jgi:hypothetical protein